MFIKQQVLLIPFLFITLLPLPLLAKTLPSEKPPMFINFCEDAETPADKQACTQKRFENAEALLKKNFDYFLRFLQGTSHLADIKNAQNSWLDYRNQECTFEAGFFEEEIAKRTLELSCLSRLTEERTLVLYNFIPRTRAQIQKESN